jgi:hypothetical protein
MLSRLIRFSGLLPLLVLAFPALARESGPAWIQVRSAHFTLITDGSDRWIMMIQ